MRAATSYAVSLKLRNLWIGLEVSPKNSMFPVMSFHLYILTHGKMSLYTQNLSRSLLQLQLRFKFKFYALSATYLPT
jgi:hypothetical protein